MSKFNVAASTGIESVLEHYAAIKSSDDMVQDARGDAYGELVKNVSSLINKRPPTLPEESREALQTLFSKREEEYMEKHHAGDEAYQKKNGSWNMSKVFDGAYKSAKSTVLGAVGKGVTLLQEDGSAKGKSALAKETREAHGVEIQGVDVVLRMAAQLAGAYDTLIAGEDRSAVQVYLHNNIMEK